MSLIGSLAAGPGVETVFNLQFVPQFLLVGGAFNNGLDLSAMSWNIAGKERVSSQVEAQINAFAKLQENGYLGANPAVNQIIQVSDGYLGNQQFQLRMTNDNAGTQDVFAFSRRRGNGRLFSLASQTILASANQRFQGFLSLIIDETNVDNLDITFFDPMYKRQFNDRFSVIEANALFGLDNISDDGQLAGLTIIDNVNLITGAGPYIESCVVYAAAGGNVPVGIVGLENLR